jgi:hypothetical protein
MGDAEVKAAGFNSQLEAMKKVGGEAAWPRFIAALTPETRALVDRPPMAMTWLPARHAVEVDNKGVELLFGGDAQRMIDVGRENFRQDLGTVYRFFVRIASPQYVAARAATIYQTYTRNNGSMRVTRSEPRDIELVIEGVVTASPAFYMLRRGNVLGAIDATGVKGAAVELVSGGGHESGCVLQATWT